MNPKYATTLANAANAAQTGLGGSPNGNSPEIQHIQNLAAIQFRAGGVTGAQNAFGGEANNVTDRDTAARALAYAQQEAARKVQEMKDKMAADLADPNNYVRSVAQDGGYNFYKPDGTPITVQEYSQATGKQINKALEGSNSRQDLEFTSEYDKLKQYGAALAGDSDAATKFKEKNGDWLNKPGNKDMSYTDVVSNFKKYYNSYFQLGQDISNSGAMRNNANTTLSPGGWLGAGNVRGINYK